MPLLRNNDYRFHPRCARVAVVYAAIQGPFARKRDWVNIATWVVYLFAAVVILLDLFVWRPF